ncbi:MAG: nickel pincer cofactor biosynthesis protein LarB [Proteobacteria bacterium]|nr:nickel pincer cofactor biosynthesis protein LarB [Pseudomonadota bacterium]
MTQRELREMLEKVADGSVSVDEMVLALKKPPIDDLGYAKVDMHRGIRQSAVEVIYGAGKSAVQIAGIVQSLLNNSEKAILITRLEQTVVKEVEHCLGFPVEYHAEARVGIVGKKPEPDGMGVIVVATAGTSDIPVAQEAALTAEFLGNRVTRLFDVGIAGLHRIISNLDVFQQARVIIAVAGMEGALPSVLAGLVDCPVIAVPTSVGYGASFQGLAALLAMLNSCASGVSVVNIDNGFGAAFQASLINHVSTEKIG